MIIVVSGPGGLGKGTIVARLVSADDRLWLSRSWTTRPRRPGEDADAYVFVDRAAFDDRIAADGLLEWAEFLGERYGTPRPTADEVPEGRDVVLEIELQGAMQVRAADPDALLVFVDAPSIDEQRRRLLARGDAPVHVERRLAKGDEERRLATDLGATVGVNDDLEDAVGELASIISAARRAQAGFGGAGVGC